MNTLIPRFSRSRPKNKNTLLKPLERIGTSELFDSCSGVRAMPRDVQGAERKKKVAAITVTLQVKQKH